jgi:hypothetical protein
MPTAVNQSDGGNLGQVVAGSLDGEKVTRHVRAKYPPVSVGREHRTDCKVCHDFAIAVAELHNQMNESRSKAKAVGKLAEVPKVRSALNPDGGYYSRYDGEQVVLSAEEEMKLQVGHLGNSTCSVRFVFTSHHAILHSLTTVCSLLSHILWQDWSPRKSTTPRLS